MFFNYGCRCGSEYVITEEQVHDRVDLIGCEGCSENIRVRYDDDEEPGTLSTTLNEDEIGRIFGDICSDSQVYIAERMLISDLIHAGFPPERILRYRINYRAEVIDSALPQYKGVSHSFDDFIWWFTCLSSGKEQERVKKWLEPIHGLRSRRRRRA